MDCQIIKNLEPIEKLKVDEYASTLWNYVSRTWAEKGWKKLLGWMSRSRHPAMAQLARTIRKHLWEIINAIYFHLDDLNLYLDTKQVG